MNERMNECSMHWSCESKRTGKSLRYDTRSRGNDHTNKYLGLRMVRDEECVMSA